MSAFWIAWLYCGQQFITPATQQSNECEIYLEKKKHERQVQYGGASNSQAIHSPQPRLAEMSSSTKNVNVNGIETEWRVAWCRIRASCCYAPYVRSECVAHHLQFDEPAAAVALQHRDSSTKAKIFRRVPRHACDNPASSRNFHRDAEWRPTQLLYWRDEGGGAQWSRLEKSSAKIRSLYILQVLITKSDVELVLGLQTLFWT